MCSVTVPHALKSAELERPEPRRILPVAPEPNPTSATAPDQLAGSPKPIREHLVDQQVEADLLAGPEVPQSGGAMATVDGTRLLSRTSRR